MTLTSVLYHNIAERETDFEVGLGLTTHPDTFEKHLRYYQKNYDIIDLDTLLSGRLPRRALLLTFDDCYRSVLDATRRFLNPRGVPAVFFVNPSLVGGGISLDNWIAWAARRHGLSTVTATLGLAADEDATVASVIAKALGRCSAKERRNIRRTLEAAFPISAKELQGRSPMLEVSDIAELGRLGVEVGNHTASHVHCGALNPEEYADELVGAQAALETMSGKAVRSFSVAYGHERDLPAPVLTTLRDSGHQAIFLVHARSNSVRKSHDVWYRVSFRNEDISKLPLKLSVLPVIRTLRDQVFR